MDHQRQTWAGIPADGPHGRARLDLRVHRLPQKPSQRVAGTHRRCEEGDRVGT
ncbi:carboxylesterase family domain protein [Mycobacterium xenopi 4042]|uniref:Carboxylesterase family domain protein n=1 Tax=Mycobacterium xenopi 4042 TaxID=1299334 RepID=X8APQ9_MYCXE|nr:carboxylesterase family domain protein [Mycobacterium xenopi 4042]